MRTCKICTSKDRAAIEQDLLSGVSYRIISQKYGVSQDSIGRHKRAGHIENKVAEVTKQTNLANAIDYWEKLELLEQKCEEYLGLVEQNKIEGTRSQYVRELRETLKLILQIIHAKKEQEREEDSPFKIITSAPWQILMRILKNIYPGVEKKVLEVFRREHKVEQPDQSLAEGYQQENVEEVLKGEFEFRDEADREDMEVVDLPGVRLVVGRSHKPKFAGEGSGKKIEPQQDAIEPAPPEPDQDKEQAEGPSPIGQADEPGDEWEELIFREDENDQS